VAVVVEHYVVRLQISVDDVSLVEVLEGEEHFSDVKPSSVLSEALLTSDYLTQVTARAEVEDQEQLCLRLERVIQVHDKRMSHVR